MRKYNENLKSMVENYRDRLEAMNANTAPYSNEALFNLIEYWSGLHTPSEQFEAVLDDVRAKAGL